MEDITKWQDLNIPVDEVFLDFAKAFDKVPHQRLLYKLKKLGITGTILTWVESFLNKRSQRVKVSNSLSSRITVKSGVPQGSVLGPVLFIAYVCDLPCHVCTSSKIFADDTKIYGKAKTLHDAELLQKDLDSLSNWCYEWGMSFNKDKCVVMHYGQNNPKHIYHINGTLLTPCKTYKDLGVMVSDNLKASEQIDKCVTKANSMLGMIKRTFSTIDEEIFLKTYKAFVRPILEYCQQVWSPYLQKDIDSIEKIQRRATKLVPGLKKLSYEERLMKLKLFTLEERRIRGDMILLYKMFHGHVDFNPNKLFTVNTDNRTSYLQL